MWRLLGTVLWQVRYSYWVQSRTRGYKKTRTLCYVSVDFKSYVICCSCLHFDTLKLHSGVFQSIYDEVLSDHGNRSSLGILLITPILC